MTDRRKLLVSDPVWSPAAAGPIAWYYAAGQYVSLSGAKVVTWQDKLAAGNDIVQASNPFRPDWESVNGWSANRSSIRSVSQTLASQGGGLAPVESAFSGQNKPFTALVTCEVLLLSGNSTVCEWTGSGGVRQACVVNGSGFLSMSRSDGVDSISITATVSPVTSGHTRLAFTFDGITGNAYINILNVVSASFSAPAVDSLAFTAFTIGNVRDLRYTEVVVYPRGLSAAEVALYYAYSLNEWG